ncbi:hypothetical protein B795N_00680 [Marinilactibacillus psychrotolerans]|uniref:DUF7446 family protein n=1 Tax=Marinilactibacillus psychrotolerans TaxID=191770 RepID=UPI001C7D922D|nr:hypothetical protein [Marinilactibacillus psychrotolerans]GEQ32186.1 hypothetical protein B795N_00680 [Marinilactibacillus psychrotolerans]
MKMIDSFRIALAGLSGEIYLTKMLKGGTMSDTRRVVTDEVLGTATDWFIKNKQKMVGFKMRNDRTAYLFHTTDESKKERIMDILKEKDEE